MNTTLEDRVREVLAQQAAALQPPASHPGDAVVVSFSRQPPRRGAGRLLIAAAVTLVLGGVVALAALITVSHRDGRPATGDEPPGNAAFSYKTSTVQLEAASIEVRAGERTFVPPVQTAVNSDPGTPNQYTTLELEWSDNGTPMRINMYFTSDGTDWWADELRTYDGSPGGEWIEMRGEYFRSPLQTTFHGDLDVGPLHIHGMALRVFTRPAACGATDKPVALSPTQTAITIPGSVSGYATSVNVLDTVTCQPIDVGAVSVRATADDPSVVEIVDDASVPGQPSGAIRVEMRAANAGITKVHVAISDPTTGVLIDEAVIDVKVETGTT